MTDLIKRDDALRIVEEYDVLHDHIKALPVVTVGVKPLYFGGQGDPFVATQEDGVEYTIKDAGNWWEWADNIGHWGRGYGSQEGAMFGAEAQDLARLHSTLELTPAIDPAIDPAAIREAALQARIEELVKDQKQGGEDYCALMEKHDALHVKLAKAVEALRIARVYLANNAQGWSADRSSARLDLRAVDATLAELEGKDD